MPQNDAENEDISTRQVFSAILRNVFRGDAVTNPPWPRMILCAIATLFPLLSGFHNGHIQFAIFGGLTGYLLALNDHLGTLGHRLWVRTLSAIILGVGFFLGQHFQSDTFTYVVILGIVTYWLGLFGGDGAELERAVLFAMVGFITAFETKSITSDIMAGLFLYSCLAYACLMIGGPLIYWTGRHNVIEHTGLRNSLKVSLTLKIERHIYAACFTLIVLLSVWFSNEFHLEHGSWITITVLIILRPDRMLTVYKTLQRFIGTIAGVLIADSIVLLVPPQILLIAVLGACAFVIPWAMLKNYWLTSFLVTIFVVLLLELGSEQHGSIAIGTLRIEATFIGCALSLVGVGLFRSVDQAFRRSRFFLK